MIFAMYFFQLSALRSQRQSRKITWDVRDFRITHTLWTDICLTASRFRREYGQWLVLCTRGQKRATLLRKERTVRSHLAPRSGAVSFIRCLIPVVRVNIRGRSHCTWLRCPIRPALMESRTAAAHVSQGCEWGQGAAHATEILVRLQKDNKT